MKHYDYIITGAGAAGLMLAYRLAKDSFFDDKSILIVDPIERNSDDRTWSFWEVGDGEWDDLVSKSWNSIIFADSKAHQKIPLGPYRYKMIQSKAFYDEVWSVIRSKPNIKFFKQEIVKLISNKEDVEVHTKHSIFTASKVFNSIPNDSIYKKQTKYPVLQQHFVGWFIKTDTPCFDPLSATFMDFSIPQDGNTRFIYVLPLKSNEALVEYTMFSKELLDDSSYEDGIKAYLNRQGITNFSILRKEKGAIPMTAYPFSSQNSSNLIQIGTNGGWTKASTGYTFHNCSKKTQVLRAALKDGSHLKTSDERTKFAFYDLLFLDVLSEQNHRGSELFSRLFNKTDIKVLLKFLDESTTLMEDISIMRSVPAFTFIRVLLKRLFS